MSEPHPVYNDGGAAVPAVQLSDLIRVLTAMLATHGDGVVAILDADTGWEMPLDALRRTADGHYLLEGIGYTDPVFINPPAKSDRIIFSFSGDETPAAPLTLETVAGAPPLLVEWAESTHYAHGGAMPEWLWEQAVRSAVGGVLDKALSGDCVVISGSVQDDARPNTLKGMVRAELYRGRPPSAPCPTCAALADVWNNPADAAYDGL